MQKSFAFYLLGFTKIALFALAFVGFVIYPNVLYPDVFTKGLFVRFLITASAVGFLWLLLRGEVPLPRSTPLTLSIGAFLLVSAASMALSPSLYRSFWGEAQRMEGVFGLLHYGVLYLIARAVFEKKDWRRYFRLVILTVLPLGLYAVLQRLSAGADTNLPLVLNPSLHPGSLFGNPAFFSMFLIFAAGFALLLAFDEERRSGRVFSMISLAVSLVVIFWLGIRGEVLGVFAGAVTFFGLWAFGKGERRYRQFFLVSLAAVFALILLLVVFRSSLAGYYPRLIQRFVNLPEEPSFVTRKLSLESSLKAFLDSPKTVLVGWGPEHFITGYNKYYNPEHGTYEDVWFDRAHNKLADVLVTTGLLGFLSYLSIFGVILWYLARLTRSKEGRIVVPALGALVVAYFVQNLTLFDLPQSYVNFFLVAAFLDSLLYPPPEREGSRRVSSRSPHAGALASGALGTAAALILVIYATAIPLNQSRLYLSYLRSRAGDELVKNFDSIFRPRNFAHYTLLDDLWRRLQTQDAFRNPAFLPLTDLLIGELAYVAHREPADATMALRLGNVLTEKAVGLSSAEDYKKGEEFIRRAIALSPTRQESYYALAFNLQGQGRKEEAVELMREAVALNPKTRKARYVLGINLALAGDLEAAVREIEGVRREGWFANPNFQAKDVQNVLKIYAAAGRRDLIEEFLKFSLENALTKDREYFVLLLQEFIRKEDKDNVIFWANEYKKIYLEFRNDMEAVIDLAKKGSWEALKKLSGVE